MTNEERWVVFINELKEYIEEHHLGLSKHTSLYNQCRYFKRKLKEGRWTRRRQRRGACAWDEGFDDTYWWA